jgi:fructokinase
MTSPSFRTGFRAGIDLGGTKIAGVLFDGSEQVVAETRRPSPHGDYDATLEAIAAVVRDLEATA